MRKSLVGAGALLAGLMLSGSAGATTYNVDQDHCTSGCGLSGTIGEIFVTGDSSSLTVDVDLNALPSDLFIHTGSSAALWFNLAGSNIAFSGVSADNQSGTPGWTFTSSGPGSFSEDHVGEGNYAILCDSTVSGNTCGKTLDFTITGNNLAFNFLTLDNKTDNNVFGISISNGKGNTGPWGADLCTENCLSPPSNQLTTPLPGAFWLFGTALGAMGAANGFRRRRKLRAMPAQAA